MISKCGYKYFHLFSFNVYMNWLLNKLNIF